MIDLSFCCFRIRWMLALIDDGCFGVWSFSVGGFVRSSIFFPLFPSFILFVFQKLVVVESLLICERMLIIYGCVQVPETSVLVLFSLLVCVISKCCLLVTFLVCFWGSF
ncbi:hypothetical protein YC2023_121268 [Brassica napus]